MYLDKTSEQVRSVIDETKFMKIFQLLKTFIHRAAPPAIASPEEDAMKRYGQHFYQIAKCTLMEPYASFHTTSEFASLDLGYVRHCGPTAMVNLIMTLLSYYKKEQPDAKRLFRQISALGRRRHFYYNMDFLKLFGGTLNLSVHFYMKALLRKCCFKNAAAGFCFPARPYFLKKQLDAGRILFVILSFHPRYGAHHLMVYGYRRLISADGHKKKLYLLTADGWSGEACYLNADDLRLSSFVSCQP